MVNWITLLPYVVEVAKITIPAFTKKRKDQKETEIIPTQIKELQAAVTYNAQTVQTLAKQLKETLENLDAETSRYNKELTYYRKTSQLALLIAVLALLSAFLLALNT